MISQMKAQKEENRRTQKMYAEMSMQAELLKEALRKNDAVFSTPGDGRKSGGVPWFFMGLFPAAGNWRQLAKFFDDVSGDNSSQNRSAIWAIEVRRHPFVTRSLTDEKLSRRSTTLSGSFIKIQYEECI